MKNYCILLCFLLSFNGMYAQCDSVYFRYTATLIKDVAFINQNVIVAVGDNHYIIKSVDGGKSWRNIRVDYNNYLFKAVQFPTDSIGYVTGNGGIMKTEDQGENWFPLLITDNPSSNEYNDLYFFDKDTGFFVGDNGHLLSTTNGGRTFKDTLIGTDGFKTIHFINDSIGLAAGDAIFKTTDRGKTWSRIDMSAFGFVQINKIKYITPSVAYAVGEGLFLRSTDSGKTWIQYPVPTGGGGSFEDLYFFNKDTGIVVGLYGGGFLMKTENGGQTFSTDFGEVPSVSSYYTIDADPKEKTILIAGGGQNDVFGYNGRTMLSSYDRGNTWNIEGANGRVTYYHTQSFNDSTAIISGDAGIMLKTYDYGETWKQLGSVQTAAGNPSRVFNFTDTLHGYAATDELFRTNDGGRSWIRKTLPWEPQVYPPQLCFLSIV